MSPYRIDSPETTRKILEKIIRRQDTPAAKPADPRFFLKLCERYFRQVEGRLDDHLQVPGKEYPKKPGNEQTRKTLR